MLYKGHRSLNLEKKNIYMKNEIKSSRKPTCGGAHSRFLSVRNYYYYFSVRASRKLRPRNASAGHYNRTNRRRADLMIYYYYCLSRVFRETCPRKVTNTHALADTLQVYNNISNVVKTYTAGAACELWNAFLKI